MSKNKNIEIRRSKRKTMALEVTLDARIIVRVPFQMPVSEIERFINEKSVWIDKSIQVVTERKKEYDNYERLSTEEIQKLADQALIALPPKVSYYANKLGVTYGRVTIRNQKSRWGSCLGKGNLNFNCLLMLAPEEVQDYVVVHELCHRKEMNHSERFWLEVENILPDYRERRKWLKENGGAIIARM